MQRFARGRITRLCGIVAGLCLGAMLAWPSNSAAQTAPLPPPQSTAPKDPEPKKDPKDAKKPADTRDGKCDICGSCECVRKICVPKPKDRDIKKVCWSSKCEDFCVPGPSEYCGKKCEKDECGCWSYEVWKPTCAEIRTKKVPVKTEVKRKVPGFEWTPEERCSACRARGPIDPSCSAIAAP